MKQIKTPLLIAGLLTILGTSCVIAQPKKTKSAAKDPEPLKAMQKRAALNA